jgi:hypothetical protein
MPALRPRQLPRQGTLTIKIGRKGCIRQAWLPSGQRLLAEATPDGELVFYRYDDGAPDKIAGQTLHTSGGAVETRPGREVLEASGVSDCSLGVRRSGIVDLLSCKDGAVTWRQSRDGGGVFVADQLADGFELVEHHLDEDTGCLGVMLFKEADSTWWVQVGTMGADGKWQKGQPRQVATKAGPVKGEAVTGSLRRSSDGIWHFAYRPEGSTQPEILRCRALSSSGSLIWV